MSFHRLSKNLKTLSPKDPMQKKIVVVGVVVLLLLLTLFAYYWWDKKRPIDPEVVYTERVSMANDSLDIMQSVDDIASTTGDIESQLNPEDYDTYLGIANDNNAQALQEEYQASLNVGTDIANMVHEHETQVRELGGIADVEGMIAIDTLPIQDQDVRNTMLANMGVTPEQYATLKNEFESKNGQVSRSKEAVSDTHADEHDHDHDHHDHAH